MSDTVPISSESYQGSRARQLFAQALAQPTVEQRHRFLGEACGADHQMRSLLLSLLEAHEQMGAFLERDGTSDPDAAPVAQILGESIGPYKLLLQLGEGGC